MWYYTFLINYIKSYQATSGWPTSFIEHLSAFLTLSKHLFVLILAIFFPTCHSLPPCLDDFYWDSYRNVCIECSQCNGEQMITRRPCQSHTDTVCGTFNDVDDWNWSVPTEDHIQSNWKEVWGKLPKIDILDDVTYVIIKQICTETKRIWAGCLIATRVYRSYVELASGYCNNICYSCCIGSDIRHIHNVCQTLEAYGKDRATIWSR